MLYLSVVAVTFTMYHQKFITEHINKGEIYMAMLTTDEAMAILEKYDHKLYEYYKNNAYCIGSTMKMYAEQLKKNNESISKSMTREQMIRFARENPDIKIGHPLFSEKEYLYTDGYAFYDENGTLFESWDNSDHCAIGMRMRNDGLWLNGWFVKE